MKRERRLPNRQSNVVMPEFEHYDLVARGAEHRLSLRNRLREVATFDRPWGEPPLAWVDSRYDVVAQADVNSHVASSLAGGAFVQLGGTGQAALKALLAGAASATLVSPVAGEAELTMDMAHEFGLAHRFKVVVGTGESAPLPDESADVVVSEACLHHMDVTAALREARRILKPGGRFGAFDPWHARLYDLGTGLLGKRDRAVDCRPLNLERVAKLSEIFPTSEVRLHGALTRYLFVAMGKFRVKFSMRVIFHVTKFDDWLSRPFRALRDNGSSAAVLAIKEQAAT